MSILNSRDIEDLQISKCLMVVLYDLNIKSVVDEIEELDYAIEYDFADCCKSRLKYCECLFHRGPYR